MMFLDELAWRLELELEPGTMFVIKIAQLNERMQGLTSGRERPVVDHVKFGLRRAIAIAG
jgi:hypothetical protein